MVWRFQRVVPRHYGWHSIHGSRTRVFFKYIHSHSNMCIYLQSSLNFTSRRWRCLALTARRDQPSPSHAQSAEPTCTPTAAVGVPQAGRGACASQGRRASVPCTSLAHRGTARSLRKRRTCHSDASPKCAHVSINAVACNRTKRTLVGCACWPHPISVLEFTAKNEVDETSMSRR